MIHPNLTKLSYNSQILLEACPRLFELDRLAPRPEYAQNVHLDFGTLLGKLVQDYLTTDSVEDAIWQAFLSVPEEVFHFDSDEDEKKHKKDFWLALHALDKFVAYRGSTLNDYSVATYEGKPATELGFIINCPGDFQYRGKLDALLINRDNTLACLEVKTTGSNYVHEAMFRNSGQGIGYSLVVDIVAKRLGIEQRVSFPVFYPVYLSRKREWHDDFKFYKSRTSLANWIRHLLRTIQHTSEYAEDNYFPMHGQNCFRFNSPCRFFEQCDMQNKYLVGEKPEVKVDKEEDYQFTFSLDELIDNQLGKVS